MIAGRRSLLLLALVAALALGLWACSVWRGEPSKGRLIFPHARHVKEAACADCHAGVEKSRTATAGKFIAGGHGACNTCHEEEVKSRCDTCHRGARSGIRLSRPDRGLSFSHAAHTKTPCKSCHLEGKEPGALVPGHATCNTAPCHRAAYTASRCSGCHRDLQRYRLKPVTALKHGPGFRTAHGGMARQNIRSCAGCHDQSYCAECHAARTAAATPSILFPEKVDRGFIHRGDYLTRHALEARADQGTCFKCHGQRGCRACHALNGLAAPPDTQRPGGVTRRQHPGGWMTAGSGEHHGRKARQDIARCASCHDRGAQSNCVGCHRVGGSGGSPHPRGWSWRNKSSVCASTAVCATCHPAGRGCR